MYCMYATMWRTCSLAGSHAYTSTGYLPENFLPEFLDLVVWGHEHECLIDPRYNPEMNFHVMQPGSSVATSLMPGEAVPKHVAILSVTGKEFKVERIRLKTVRPFVMKEIVLAEDKKAVSFAKKGDNRTALTRHLMDIVESMIEEAKAEWKAARDEAEDEEEEEAPLPLIRLRVEYTAPEGGNFDCENPQRFSNRFVGKVANVNDVVQFHRKKAGSSRKAQNGADLPEESILAQLSIDSIKVEKLVREFLTAQSLTILPQNSFGDAVSQFVDKDDKHAMEVFVEESLLNQVKHLMTVDEADEDEIMAAMDHNKSNLEKLFAAGLLKKAERAKRKPRPEDWNSEFDGAWSDQPAAIIHSDDGDADDGAAAPAMTKTTTAKGKGKAAATKKATAPAKKAGPTKPGRGKTKVVEEESEEEDVVMIDDDEDEDEDEDESHLMVEPAPPTRTTKRSAPAKKSVSAVKRAPARGAAAASGKQSKLTFSQPPSQAVGRGTKAPEVSDDDISDDDDAFAPAPSTATVQSTRSRR